MTKHIILAIMLVILVIAARGFWPVWFIGGIVAVCWAYDAFNDAFKKEQDEHPRRGLF